MSQFKQELTHQAGGQVLPASVIAGTIAGIPINTVILWLTLLYLVIQILVIIPKARDAIRELRNRKGGACE